MNTWQLAITGGYGLMSGLACWRGYIEAVKRGEVFGLAGWWRILGIFVWGDAVIIGGMGLLAAGGLLFINDWWLAVTVWSLFWAVRALGEMVYWLNQQFSGKVRNPPLTLFGHKWFKGDSVWFVYQLGWQGILVLACLLTLYAAKKWLG